MKRPTVIITGAAGFLGSATVLGLCPDYQVIALDRRSPSAPLAQRAGGVAWHRLDIANAQALAAVLRWARTTYGQIDFLIHFAAYYHFGADWRQEYEATNVQGTANVLRCAADHGVQRVIFASSIAALLPPPPSQALTEKTPAADYIPYAKSKSLGEQMVLEASNRVPGIVLRIAGVFGDWSELPPLSSLIRFWTGRSILSRLVVGQGTTGIPYIHREDLVRMVRRCLERHDALGSHEVFLASQQGVVLHRDLFAAIRQADPATPGGADSRPVLVAPGVARLGLYLGHMAGAVVRRRPFERPWMLRYADRPWVVDATHTCQRLGWSCSPGMGLLDRLPTMLAHFRQDHRLWEQRNRARERGRYLYHD